MRVVVTGGAGFIGSAVCRELVNVGHSVVVLDDLSSGRRENLDGLPDVELVVGQAQDQELILRAARGADALVHLAADVSVVRSLEDPWRTHRSNLDSTLAVLQAAREHSCHVTLASSSAVYGEGDPEPRRETEVPAPMSAYGASKSASESYVQAYRASFGLRAVAWRFFNVYGPGQPAGHAYAAVIPAFVSRALAGEPLLVYGDGGQSRDFVSVTTVAAAVARGVTARIDVDGAVNLASGSTSSILGLIDRLREVIDRPLRVEHRPARPGEVRESAADISRLRAVLPELTDPGLEAGLRATVDWWLETQPHDGPAQ